MRSIYLAAAVFAATLLASCGEKKVNLLESDSMDRWKVVVNEDSLGRTAFTIEEGILKISGMPFGYIRSAQSFSDYTLSLEWRWTGEKGVDGGIFNFLQGEDKVWPLGVQFQMTPEDMGVLMGGIPLEGVEGPFYKKPRLVESSPERPLKSLRSPCQQSRVRSQGGLHRIPVRRRSDGDPQPLRHFREVAFPENTPSAKSSIRIQSMDAIPCPPARRT